MNNYEWNYISIKGDRTTTKKRKKEEKIKLYKAGRKIFQY